MDKTIIIGKIELSYNLDALISAAKSIQPEDPEEYGPEERAEMLGVPDFMVLQDKFIRQLILLDSNIEELYKKGAIVTKKGTLHAGRNQILLKSGLHHNHYYNDDYGNHTYKEICLIISSLSDTKAKIIIGNINRQA